MKHARTTQSSPSREVPRRETADVGWGYEAEVWKHSAKQRRERAQSLYARFAVLHLKNEHIAILSLLCDAMSEHYEKDPDLETISCKQSNTYVKHIVSSVVFVQISGSGSLG